MLTEEEKVRAIDDENGVGFSKNINMRGYTFTKNGSFITFEFKEFKESEDTEGITCCSIKYIYWKNVNDLFTVLASCCNFWMGNRVKFIYYKEKRKENSIIDVLHDLGFKKESISVNWKYPFRCRQCHSTRCNCWVYSLYK
jgi:hypothetical protein